MVHQMRQLHNSIIPSFNVFWCREVSCVASSHNSCANLTCLYMFYVNGCLSMCQYHIQTILQSTSNDAMVAREIRV